MYYQDMAGTKRDISGGREFSYVSATEYTMQVFDRINDSRFWKSFITCYGANDTNGAPVWTAKDIASGKAPAGAQKDGKRFKAGDVGIRYIVNNPGDTRFSNYEEINEETGEPVTVEGKVSLNPQLHSRSATYIKRNGLLIRKITIKSSRPFQCAYHPLTP